jgi:hypothetical protein
MMQTRTPDTHRHIVFTLWITRLFLYYELWTTLLVTNEAHLLGRR